MSYLSCGLRVPGGRHAADSYTTDLGASRAITIYSFLEWPRTNHLSPVPHHGGTKTHTPALWHPHAWPSQHTNILHSLQQMGWMICVSQKISYNGNPYMSIDLVFVLELPESLQ